MAIQCIGVKPVLSPTKQHPVPIQYKTSIYVGTGTRWSWVIKAVESVPWEVRVPPNAVRRQRSQLWSGGFSLGVDLGLSRTAIAISKGITIRPLTVGELAGEELEAWLLDLALKQDVDEFIIGLPKEIEESKKVRSVAARLAVGAAERKRRVFLQDERGASCEGVDLDHTNMIAEGSDGEQSIHAYAAMKILQIYFSTSGKGIELVVPHQKQLQFNISQGRPTELDYF